MLVAPHDNGSDINSDIGLDLFGDLRSNAEISAAEVNDRSNSICPKVLADEPNEWLCYFVIGAIPGVGRCPFAAPPSISVNIFENLPVGHRCFGRSEVSPRPPLSVPIKDRWCEPLQESFRRSAHPSLCEL